MWSVREGGWLEDTNKMNHDYSSLKTTNSDSFS